MRIISDFKDYYDSAAAYGVDMERVYARKARTEIIKTKDCSLITDMPRVDVLIPARGPGAIRSRSEKADGILLCVAGKLYPFYSRIVRPTYQNPYCLNSFQKEFSNDVSLCCYTDSSWFQDSYAAAEKWIKDNTGRDVSYINDMYKSPLVLIHVDKQVTTHHHYKETEFNVIVNPKLSDYNFAKVVDPYQMFQNISMYIDGVMSLSQEEAPKQTDKEKILSHGLDMRYGFRHRPK